MGISHYSMDAFADAGATCDSARRVTSEHRYQPTSCDCTTLCQSVARELEKSVVSLWHERKQRRTNQNATPLAHVELVAGAARASTASPALAVALVRFSWSPGEGARQRCAASRGPASTPSASATSASTAPTSTSFSSSSSTSPASAQPA